MSNINDDLIAGYLKPAENIKAEVTTKRFITCPGCGSYQHCVEHLFDGTERSFYEWKCGDEDCRTATSGAVHANGTITISTRETEPRGFALLKLRDLYLVRREIYGRIERAHADYFYHSHQCPKNLLRDIVEVYGPSGEHDRHGMIRYVAGIEDTPETREKVRSGLSFRELLEMFGTDGEPIASDYPEENEGMIPIVAEMMRAGRKES